jgi:hypothetical protein
VCESRLDEEDWKLVGKRKYQNKMIEKAKKLIRNNRVEHLEGHRYNVIGDHGTYSVVIDQHGLASCNCPGFRSKRRCSHSAALEILRSKSKRTRIIR